MKTMPLTTYYLMKTVSASPVTDENRKPRDDSDEVGW